MFDKRTLLSSALVIASGLSMAQAQYTAPAVVPVQNAAPQQIQQQGQAVQQMGQAVSRAGTVIPNHASSAFAASAQHVYVSCVIPPANKVAELHFDFTLDEASGAVSFYWANQTQFLRAVFSAESVTWDQPFYGAIIHRTINRVSLEYTDETIEGHKVSTSKGSCKVVTPSPDRKF